MIDRLGAQPVPIQLPVGREGGYRGSIDLVSMKAYVYDDESLGATYKITALPSHRHEDPGGVSYTSGCTFTSVKPAS